MLTEETLSQKFIKKGFWLYLFTFFIGPLGYITKVILSRDLSVEEVGMIYGVISFVSLIAVYNDLGFTESLNFFLPKYVIEKQFGKAKYLLFLAGKTQIVSSAVIILLLFLVAPWLAEHYFKESIIIEVLRISTLFFLGINIIHFTGVIFSVSQDTKIQKAVEFVRILSVTIGAGILFLGGIGTMERYMWIWIFGLFVAVVFSLYFFFHKYYKVYFLHVAQEKIPEERNHFLKYSLASLLTSNIGTVLSQVDMQLIIILLGSLSAGYYSNYLSLLNIPFIFISPIISFLFPVISELSGRKDTKKMKIIWSEFSLYFSLIGIWTGIFLFQMGESISLVFFGEKFRESGNILAYSAFFLIFNLLTQINFQILAGTGRIKDRIRILLTILPINIILNIVLIQILGAPGSALAVGLSWVPLWYLSHRSTRSYHQPLSMMTLGKNIVLGSIAYICIWYLGKEGVPLETVWGLCVAVLINLTIFSLGNLSLLREILKTIHTVRKT